MGQKGIVLVNEEKVIMVHILILKIILSLVKNSPRMYKLYFVR